jgi:queuine tRNA-ribosyltransferase
MNWPHAILTDPGGYQVMPLAELRKVSEAGVTFRSHIDGAAHELTPERSIQIQHSLGADITMAFDECTPYPIEEAPVADSMRLSMRWAERCKAAFVPRPGHGLFGIVQGSVYPELRAESAARVVGIGFDGHAGRPRGRRGPEKMFEMPDFTGPLLPADAALPSWASASRRILSAPPRRGIDMFDCVLPTRSGRTGQAFTRRGALNIRNARHLEDPRPLDEACACPACRNYSRAYLHHLWRAEEILGQMLLTWHNLHYYQQLMASLRAAIAEARLDTWIAIFASEQARRHAPLQRAHSLFAHGRWQSRCVFAWHVAGAGCGARSLRFMGNKRHTKSVGAAAIE